MCQAECEHPEFIAKLTRNLVIGLEGMPCIDLLPSSLAGSFFIITNDAILF